MADLILDLYHITPPTPYLTCPPPLPSPGAAPSLPKTNCLEAKQVCLADPQCEALYQTLEGCASDRAVSSPGSEARLECLEALVALHSDRLLLGCKCHRGIRKEEHCLRVYWSLHFLQGEGHRGGVIDISMGGVV